MKAISSVPEGSCHVTAADGNEIPVPSEMVCPLTLDVMVRPIISREGHSYEQSAILNWVAEHGTSPLTRQPLLPSQLVRNRALETKIQLFLRQHGVERSVDEKENESKFIGFVSAPDKLAESNTQDVLTLQNNLSHHYSIMQGDSSSVTNDRANARAVPEECVVQRRRQIADLIGSAMQDLDDI